MADQNITELPVKTSSGISASDYLLGIDSAEGYQMLIRDLGDYIIRNVAVNPLGGANQTLKAAIDSLNSKMAFYDLNTNVKSASLTFFEHLQTIPNKSVAIYNGYAPEYVPSDIPTWAIASITILAFRPTTNSDTIHLTAFLIASNGTAGIMYGRGQWKQIV